MGKTQKTILSILSALALAALAAVILTWHWGNYRERLRAMRTASRQNETLVDTRAVDTAEQLSQLAETRTEKGYAQEAQRIADYSVDAAFAAALQDAAANPAPLTPETRQIAQRLKAADAAVTADQNRIAQLTRQVAKARANTKDSLQQQLDLAQEQLELDQDDLDDAHQDLARAGGDRHATIQRLLDEHEAAQKAAVAQANTNSAANAPPSIELTKSDSLVAQAQAWFSLNSKQKLLIKAQQNAFDRQSKLAAAHDALNKTLTEEKAQKKIIPKKSPGAAKPARATNGKNSGATETVPSNAEAGTGGTAPSDSAGGPGNTSDSDDAIANTPTLSFLKDLSVDQKNLTLLDKRIENEQELATLYGNWISYVTVRKQAFLHGVFVASFWILLIALFVFGANEGTQRFFSDLSPERRALQKLQAVVLFGIEALGIVLILLVVFGMPNNFATVVALAGAGLTVALKDFIVGFFGWFVLMGKDGIRPGDWVEINGVAGEVLEVGLFQTVLLETGNWADAAHPTGRKVTFVNSFAIEGHYFNFSTSGQWLWDELQVQAPPDADPYKVAEAIQRIAADDTAANAKVAETEWQRVVPASVNRTFSAAPSVSVRPEGGGVSILVRYLTRASDRQEVRTRLYRAVIDLLRQKNSREIPQPSAAPQQPDPGKK
ncbi:MAG: mechanosensitive ion channel family protein [Candidatus Acidiferrales bacterium]